MGSGVFVVLICVSLMANDVSIFSCAYWSFMCLLLKKCLLRSFAYFFLCMFLNWVICHFIIEIIVVCILDTSPLSEILFAVIFFHHVGCLLNFFLMSSNKHTSFKILIMYNLPIFVIVAYDFVIFWRLCILQAHNYLSLCFLQKVL